MLHTLTRTLLLCGLLTAALAGGTTASAANTCRLDSQGGCVSPGEFCTGDGVAFGACADMGGGCWCWPI